MCRPGPNKKVLIVFTDSQGLITALQKEPVRQRDTQLASIWKSLYILHQNGIKRVIFQWIPSHCGVLRNENADTAARRAINTFGPITKRRVPVRYQNYKEKNRAHYLSALQAEPSTRCTLTTAPANLSYDNSLGRRRQTKLAQLGLQHHGVVPTTLCWELRQVPPPSMQMVWRPKRICVLRVQRL